MFKTIKDKIVAKLIAIDEIAEVNDYAKVGFQSNPAVNVIAMGNTGEFWSVADNQRSYNYSAWVFVPLKGNPKQAEYDNSKQQAEEVLWDVVDAILTAFDEDITLDRTVNFMRAASSSPEVAEIEDSFVLISEVKIQAIKNISVR